MSLGPSGELKLGPKQIAELRRYYKATMKQHPSHPMMSGAMPVHLEEGVDSIWITYCLRCKKFAGMSLVNDKLRQEIAVAEVKRLQ